MGWHPSAALLMVALLSVFWREEYSAHCGVSRALASAIPIRNVAYLLIERGHSWLKKYRNPYQNNGRHIN